MVMIKDVLATIGGVIFVLGLFRAWAGLSQLFTWASEERSRVNDVRQILQRLPAVIENGAGSVGGLDWIQMQLKNAATHQMYWAPAQDKAVIFEQYQVLQEAFQMLRKDLRVISSESWKDAEVRNIMFATK
jgi:hypothetical protein